MTSANGNVLQQMANFDNSTPIQTTVIFYDSDEDVKPSFGNNNNDVPKKTHNIVTDVMNNIPTVSNDTEHRINQSNVKRRLSSDSETEPCKKQKLQNGEEVIASENIESNLGQNSVTHLVNACHSHVVISNSNDQSINNNQIISNTLHQSNAENPTDNTSPQMQDVINKKANECLKTLLDTISNHMILIMKAYVDYAHICKSADTATMESAKRHYLRTKGHFFYLSYSAVSNILVPHEKDETFIKNFIDDTVKLSHEKHYVFTNSQLQTLLTQMISWVKLYRSQVEITNLNYQNPILKGMLQNRTPTVHSMSATNSQEQQGCHLTNNAFPREQQFFNPTNNVISRVQPSFNPTNNAILRQQQRFNPTNNAISRERQRYNPTNNVISRERQRYNPTNNVMSREQQHLNPTTTGISRQQHGFNLKDSSTILHEPFNPTINMNPLQGFPTNHPGAPSIYRYGPPEREPNIIPTMANNQNTMQGHFINQSMPAHNLPPYRQNFEQPTRDGANMRNYMQEFQDFNLNHQYHQSPPVRKNKRSKVSSKQRKSNQEGTTIPPPVIPSSYEVILRPPPPYPSSTWPNSVSPQNHPENQMINTPHFNPNFQSDMQESEVNRSLSRDSGFMSPLDTVFNDPMCSPTHEAEESTPLTPMITHVTSLNPSVEYIKDGTCHVCFKPTKHMCVGCYKTYYCSHQCQADDWKSHMHICKK